MIIILLVCLMGTHCSREQTEVNNIPIPQREKKDMGIFIDTVQLKTVQAGSFAPLFLKKDSTIAMEAFQMDEFPVTQERYLAFVKTYPEWQKSQVKRIFADANYLGQWESDTTLGENINPQAPVTSVSWFAAKAYCECQGKDLPTLDQWEYVASANETLPDARGDSTFNQRIVHWYETPGTAKMSVGKNFTNYWQISDIHGLVWEWAEDFNAIMLSGESRRDVSTDKNMFCGSGSIGANDLMNYAAFMRFAFRASIKANYSIRNLGFRCVKKVN